MIEQLDQAIAAIDESQSVSEICTDEMDADCAAVFERVNSLLTKLSKTQAQLNQTQLKLTSLNAELDSFAYVVSHDLKAPLRGISSLAQWIVTDYSHALDEDGREQLVMLNDRVLRMHTLIDGVLRFSRAGRGNDQCVVITMQPLIRQIADDINAGENAQVIADDGLPLVQGEPTHLSHILSCLIDNALKYNQSEQPEAHFCMKQTDAGWVYCVYDNGIGIPPHDRERVFDLFQTVCAKQDMTSSGVGLTIVKKIVNIYGGRVWFEDSPIGGVQACFTLPTMKVIPLSVE